MPEILEEAAIYFDPLNIQDMTEKIHQVLENKQLKRELIKLGYKQIQKYDWQKCAVDTLAIYSSIIN
jgi:glycosyltransferase involved in cell wall biosynthesis